MFYMHAVFLNGKNVTILLIDPFTVYVIKKLHAPWMVYPQLVSPVVKRDEEDGPKSLESLYFLNNCQA